MSKFRFKDYVFPRFFPFWYHDQDTYKDKDGRGILQRLMRVCAEYFDVHVTDDESNQPGLDNILDLIDFDKTPDLFLNYLWEFLGEIPYAYGLIIQNKPYNKDDLREWLTGFWFPKVNPRELLRYAISLYKIRGTVDFYTILGRFYGMKITLIETVNGGTIGDGDDGIPVYDHLVLATYTNNEGDESINVYSRGDEEIRASYAEGNCVSCLYFLVKVSILDHDIWERLLGEAKLEEAKEIIAALIEKYLPIHCKVGRYDDGSPKVVFGDVPQPSKKGSFDNSFDNTNSFD